MCSLSMFQLVQPCCAPLDASRSAFFFGPQDDAHSRPSHDGEGELNVNHLKSFLIPLHLISQAF